MYNIGRRSSLTTEKFRFRRPETLSGRTRRGENKQLLRPRAALISKQGQPLRRMSCVETEMGDKTIPETMPRWNDQQLGTFPGPMKNRFQSVRLLPKRFMGWGSGVHSVEPVRDLVEASGSLRGHGWSEKPLRFRGIGIKLLHRLCTAKKAENYRHTPPLQDCRLD